MSILETHTCSGGTTSRGDEGLWSSHKQALQYLSVSHLIIGIPDSNLKTARPVITKLRWL